MKLPKLRRKKKQIPPEERFTDAQIKRVTAQLADYIDTVSHTRSLLWRNFLAGTARGIGLTVGAAIVIAIVFKILTYLITLNIPLIQDYLIDIVRVIKHVK